LGFVGLFVLSFFPIRVHDLKGQAVYQPLVQHLERTGSAFFVIFMTLSFIAPTFGFVPTVRTLLSTAHCIDDPTHPGKQVLALNTQIPCWEGGHAVLFIVALIMFILFLVWALRIGRLGGAVNKTYESTANDNNLAFQYFSWKGDKPDTFFPPRHIFSRRSVTYLFFFLILKGVLVAFAIFSTDSTLIVSIFLALSVVMMAVRFIWPPFWSLKVNYLNAALGIAVVWTNALALAVVIINDPSESDIPTAALVFGMIPLIVISYFISIPFIRWRLRQQNIDIVRLQNLHSRHGRVLPSGDDSYPWLNRVHPAQDDTSTGTARTATASLKMAPLKTETNQGMLLLE